MTFSISTNIQGGSQNLVPKINVFLHSADTLRVQNFVEIALSHTIFEMNALLRFMQKFKMAAKSGGKVIFVKSRQYTLDTLGVENFDKIALSKRR